MSDKIYLVTAGSYSDYRVVIACATKELAKEIAANGGGLSSDGWSVEEYTLLHETPQHKILCKMIAWLHWSPMRIEVREDKKGVWGFEEATGEWGEPVCIAWTNPRMLDSPIRKKYQLDAPVVLVSGYDEERVRKAFAERLAEVKVQIAMLEGEDELC